MNSEKMPKCPKCDKEVYFGMYFLTKFKDKWRVTNSKDPEQTSTYMTSDPGLDCLCRSVCSIHMYYQSLYKMYTIMFTFQ